MMDIKDLTTSEIVKIVCEGLGSAKPIDNKNGILQFQTICHNPAHTGKFKLYYYADTKSFHCYTGCSESFDIIGLVKRAKHCSASKASKIINDLILYGGNKEGFDDEEDWEGYTYDCSRDMGEKKNPPIDKNYLKLFPLDEPNLWYKEGISVRSMRKFGIRMDYCNNKIIVPHFDINDNLIGIRGRALNKDEIEAGCKYMPIRCDGKFLAHSLGSNLYGINFNKENIKRLKKVILFEGEKSVMKYGDYFQGNNIALAVCGSNISQTQIQLLEDLGVEEVIIAFDKMYTENKSEEARLYREKIVKLGLKFPSSMSVYYLWDDNDLIEYKNAPIDHGSKIFKVVLKMKKMIKTRIEEDQQPSL